MIWQTILLYRPLMNILYYYKFYSQYKHPCSANNSYCSNNFYYPNNLHYPYSLGYYGTSNYCYKHQYYQDSPNYSTL